MEMQMLLRGGQGQPTGRLYCYGEPHLRLEDGTPLYLEWLLEGEDRVLYAVPAELGGWLRRSRYEGPTSMLEPVLHPRAGTIVGLLCSSLDHAEARPAADVKGELIGTRKDLCPAVTAPANTHKEVAAAPTHNPSSTHSIHDLQVTWSQA